MPQGVGKTSWKVVAVHGMNAKEISRVFPEISRSSAYELIASTPLIEPYMMAKSLGFPRPGGGNGERLKFAIKWIDAHSGVESGMKVRSMKGKFKDILKRYSRDALSQPLANVKFPFKEQRFAEMLSINHINIRSFTKFHSDNKIRLETVKKRLETLLGKKRLSAAERLEKAKLVDEKKDLELGHAIAGLLRRDHQSKRLLSNMLKNPKRAHCTLDHFSIGVGHYGLEGCIDVHVLVLYFPREPVLPENFVRSCFTPVATELELFDDEEREPLNLAKIPRATKAEMTEKRKLGLAGPKRDRSLVDTNRQCAKSRSPDLIVDPEIIEKVDQKSSDRAYRVEICVVAPKKRTVEATDDGENVDDDDEHFDGQTALAYARDLEQVVQTGIFQANGIEEIEFDSDGDPRNYVTGTGHYYISSLLAPNGLFSYVGRNIFYPREGASYCDLLAGKTYVKLDQMASIGHNVKNAQELARVISGVSQIHVMMASKEVERRLDETLPMVVKSPVPFLKAHFQFVVTGLGSFKARRSPNDPFKSFKLIPSEEDAILSLREKATEEWFHRSETLTAQRAPLSSRSERSNLKRNTLSLDYDDHESSEDEIMELQAGKRKRSKSKQGSGDDDDFRPSQKRPKKDSE
jgi:hypothetical protein